MAASVADALLLEAALSYAARGWRVFPCHSMRKGKCSCGSLACASPGKHPRTRRGCLDASTDPKTIRAWWVECPDANVAIATGSSSGGLVVVDIDPRHDGDTTWGEISGIYGVLPDTPEALTGGSGRHIYLESSEPVPSRTNAPGTGVDVRGDGGYVLAPPSNHASGTTYVWDVGRPEFTGPVAPVPQWLARLLRPRVEPTKPTADAIIEGGRNNQLTSLAGALRRKGLTFSEIIPTLLEVNRRRCRPPLDEIEVRRIAEHISTKPADDPLVSTADHAVPLLGVAEMFEPQPDANMLVPALGIAPGAPSGFFGQGYVGKSLLGMSACLSVASGHPLWGVFSVRRGKALHLDYEQGRRVSARRVQRLALGMGLTREELEGRIAWGILPRLRLTTKEAEDAFSKLLEGYAVVLLDALKGLTPGVDENSSEIRDYMGILTRASEVTGCTCLLLHHAGKTSPGGERPRKELGRGSSGIYDECQTVFACTGKKDEPIYVSHEKDRELGMCVADFGLRIEDIERDGNPKAGMRVVHLEHEQMRPDAETQHLDLVKEVYLYLIKNPDVPGVEALAARMGKRPQAVRVAVRELEAADELVNVGEPRRPRLRVKEGASDAV